MVAPSCWSCAVVLATAFLGAVVSAAEIKRLDGIHRLEKKAQITDRPVLHRRQEDSCGTGSSACPASLNGGCCPDGYGCASESCFATTRAPSTCHSRVGYYACAAVYGGTCRPSPSAVLLYMLTVFEVVAALTATSAAEQITASPRRDPPTHLPVRRAASSALPR